jgi:choline dehydrogenase-like flavoprotein
VGKDNNLMARGAAKMGWDFKINRRNQDLCVGSNNCVFGCPTGAKQSTLISYMPKAMAAGARAMTEVRVDELIIERGRCVGVQGRAINPRTRAGDKKITVRGKCIIVACGAVQSAYLLLKHKLARQSGQLGRNFFIHPNAKVLAIYPHELKGWQGVSQFGQIRHFSEEGILMADNMVAPGPLASNLPFHGMKSWEVMQAYNRAVLSGVLVEDSRSGRIRRGPFGMVIPRYDITAYDHARFLKGVRLLATMHFEMGAERVILPFDNFPEARSVDELKGIAASQRKMSTLELFTVHLMGTARMGAKARDSVVNTEGEIWDLPGCYVADASIFPTAIGVNPQITIMAMATRIAHRLADRGLKRQAA